MKNSMKKIILGTLLAISVNISHAIEVDLNNHDEALSDLADMFSNEKMNPVYKRESLDSEKLDYSLDSLKIIDHYLSEIRKTGFSQISEDLRFRTILRTGAYVGETLRKNDQSRKWHWIDLEMAKEMKPQLFNNMQPSIELTAILTDGETFTFPLNKVVKFLNNGEEDSLYFYTISSMQLK